MLLQMYCDQLERLISLKDLGVASTPSLCINMRLQVQ
jgi:hypothetical protein